MSIINTDGETLRSTVEHVLRDTAKLALGLSVGLENAAPPGLAGPTKSMLYLNETAKQLEVLSEAVKELAPSTTPRPNM